MAAPVSMNTRITLAIVVVVAPLFVWAGRLDTRVEEEKAARMLLDVRYTRERTELREDLREIQRKLDEVLTRLPSKSRGG